MQGNPLASKMLYAAIAMGYIYQGPPFRSAGCHVAGGWRWGGCRPAVGELEGKRQAASAPSLAHSAPPHPSQPPPDSLLPPHRWSYLGLGEPLCFLAFGPLATCAFYFAQVPPALVSEQVGGRQGGATVEACMLLLLRSACPS